MDRESLKRDKLTEDSKKRGVALIGETWEDDLELQVCEMVKVRKSFREIFYEIGIICHVKTLDVEEAKFLKFCEGFEMSESL